MYHKTIIHCNENQCYRGLPVPLLRTTLAFLPIQLLMFFFFYQNAFTCLP